MDAFYCLEQSEFFKNTSLIIKKRLASICIPKKVQKKEMLFLEGQQGYALYLSATAFVQLSKSNHESKPVVMKIVQPGDLFGEVILFEQDRYPVDAEVIKEGIVFIIPKQQFHCLLQDEEFRVKFIADLMQKQRYLVEKIKQIVTFDVEQRFFLFLHEHFGKKESIKINLSKKNVAEAIGTSAETLSRMLLRLKQNSICDWQKNMITLKSGFWNEWFIQ